MAEGDEFKEVDTESEPVIDGGGNQRPTLSWTWGIVCIMFMAVVAVVAPP